MAIVSDGTAVLGLGDIGPGGRHAGDGGQGAAVQAFRRVDAFPICLNTKDPPRSSRRWPGWRRPLAAAAAVVAVLMLGGLVVRQGTRIDNLSSEMASGGIERSA
nr:hypothetical protein [Candidatus Microthrix sp.]